MTEQLSELMDGELDRTRCGTALKSICHDDEQRNRWRMYHLIGDCLRGEAVLQQACADRIVARLASEPTVFAPRRAGAVGARARIALALAASVATLAVVGVIATRQASAPVQVAQKPAPPPLPAAATPGVNDYLVMHRQFANPEGLQTAAMGRDARQKGAGR